MPQTGASQESCPSGPWPQRELCAIDMSQKENIYLNLHGDVQVAVNGCRVTGRTELYHEDEIRLRKNDPLFILDLPLWRRTSALQKHPSKVREPGMERDGQGQTVILLCKDNEGSSTHYREMSLCFDVPDALPTVGLIRGGGVTFREKMVAKRDPKGERLGVFFWDSAMDINWLTHHSAGQKISSISCLALSWAEDHIWRSVASGCTVIVFCHSMRSKKSLYDLEVYLDDLLQSHGPENILMVIGDLEDRMCEKGMMAQWRQSRFSAIELLPFTETEMNVFCPARLAQQTENRLLEGKLNQIRCILKLQISEMNSTPRHALQSHKKHIIGIFSKSSSSCFLWLKTILESTDRFKFLVKEVRQFQLVAINEKLTREISKCTFVILYHTKKQGDDRMTDLPGSLYNEELQSLSDVMGKEKIIVVLDDVENSRSAEKLRILKEQPSMDRCAQDVFLFSGKEKLAYEAYQTSQNFTKGRRIQQKMEPFNKWMKKKGTRKKVTPSGHGSVHEDKTGLERKQALPAGHDEGGHHSSPLQKDFMEGRNLSFPSWIGPAPDDVTFLETQIKEMSTGQVVGIFSKSPQRDYYWLRDLLKSPSLQSQVQDVRHCFILESWEPFRWEVSQCTLGILYHSKRDGRSYITDMPGALYDKYLRYLSSQLGKKNVFVLIDDVEDPSEEERNRILEKQPSLRELANKVLLFRRDKTDLQTKDFAITEIWRTGNKT